MAYVMTAEQFVALAKKIATDYKTLYVHGCFGAPMTAVNKARYCKNTSYNAQPSRQAKIKAASAKTFGFDCVCLIKGMLWGWNGNYNAEYGGAVYKSNGVPDVGSNQIMDYCTGVSKNFNGIKVGELVHMTGHVGIYIGGGLAVECTPIWKDGVQITAVGNLGKVDGYNTRTWTDHGCLKFIDYTKTPTPSKLTLDQLVDNTIAGMYGNGAVRKSKLTSMYKNGLIDYTYEQIQKAVNDRMAQPVYHIVAKGDTLSALAKKYGTTVEAIMKLNNIKNANVIIIGQKIRIK